MTDSTPTSASLRASFYALWPYVLAHYSAAIVLPLLAPTAFILALATGGIFFNGWQLTDRMLSTADAPAQPPNVYAILALTIGPVVLMHALMVALHPEAYAAIFGG